MEKAHGAREGRLERRAGRCASREESIAYFLFSLLSLFNPLHFHSHAQIFSPFAYRPWYLNQSSALIASGTTFLNSSGVPCGPFSTS